MKLANSVSPMFDIVKPTGICRVYFLKLTLLNETTQMTDSIYWLKHFQTLKNILEMKNILLICIVLTLGTIQVYGQEISYGTGQWDPEGLGYHRAVIYVSKPAEAIKVKIPLM